MPLQIRGAAKEDLPALKQFLLDAGLGIDGLGEETVDYFLLMEDEVGEVVGTLGMEKLAENGLLRSLVVTSSQVQQDLLLLLQQAFQFARDKHITNLFLATNKQSAIPFFQLLGFQVVNRDCLPKELFASEHIQSILTVDNSIFLKFSF